MQAGDRFIIPGRVVTKNDVYMFAGLSGDHNPVHLNEESARPTQFRARIAHGMLVASFVSAALACTWPGCVYLGQSLNFRRPAQVGDAVEVELEVLSVQPDRPVATISTVCRNQRGEVVLEGATVVKLPAGEAGSATKPELLRRVA